MEPYRPNCYKISELNGLRVLLVFIVSWYHFWQQSLLTPSIGSYSLDYLLRAGYMPVDGTILLSGFLLFLPYARAMLLGEAVPNTKQFYQRRIMRIVPSYYFVTLALLFAVALPWHLYYNSSDMVRDVVMHLTFTQTFNPTTYIATPIGVASWTIAIEMQAYLIFPLLARWAMKNPLGTLMTMAAGTFAFRGWCVWRLDEYNMVGKQVGNLLDIYALGMGAALLYVWLVQSYPAAEKRKAMAWQGIATLLCVLSTWGMLRIFRVQAGESGQASLQAGQIMCRPLLGLFSSDPAVLDAAVRYTWWVLPFIWTYAVFNCMMSFVNGTGAVKYTTVVNLLILWAVRIPAAYILHALGYGTSSMACVSLSYAVGLVAMLGYFLTPEWGKLRRKAKELGDTVTAETEPTL